MITLTTCSHCRAATVPSNGRCANCKRPLSAMGGEPALAASAVAVADAPGVAANQPTTATAQPAAVEIRRADGSIEKFEASQFGQLADAVRDGRYSGAIAACWLPATAAGAKLLAPTWQTLREVAVHDFQLRRLWDPVPACAWRGFAWGFGVVAVLKALDTTVTLFAADPRIGFLWLVTLVGFVVARWFWPVLAIVVFGSMRLGLHLNLFTIPLGIMAFALALGAPLGMSLGSLWSLLSRGRLAPGAKPRWWPWLATHGVLPAAVFAFMLVSYVKWFMPWMIEALGD